MSTADLVRTHEPSMPAIADIADPVRLKVMPASAKAEALFLWRKLELQLGNHRLTCSSLWTEVWLNHFGQLIPHQFAIGMRDGAVCGIALLTKGVRQCAGPIPLTTWHIGTAGEPEADSVCVEYNALLVGPGDQCEFAAALFEWAREQTNCDEFRLDGFESQSIRTLLQNCPMAQVDRKISYYFDLRPCRENNEEPLARLGTHTRANIRRTLRDFGDVQSEWAETPARAEQLFAELVKLHQARWTGAGKPGAYASRLFHDFHLELLWRAVPLGLTTIVGLSVGNRLIGCSHLLIDNHRGLFYQCGWTPGGGRTSTGLALDYLCISECLRRGYDEVDFLAGNTEHKRRLSTNQAELAWVVWRRSSLKNAAIGTMRRLKQSAVRLRESMSLTKHNPDSAK